MAYKVEFDSRAIDDLSKIDASSKKVILKTINRVAENPLPRAEGGYGWPLGNKHGMNLTNLLKIKLRGLGYRVVYQLKRTETAMEIIVVGVRTDEEVYRMAYERLLRN